MRAAFSDGNLIYTTVAPRADQRADCKIISRARDMFALGPLMACSRRPLDRPAEGRQLNAPAVEIHVRASAGGVAFHTGAAAGSGASGSGRRERRGFARSARLSGNPNGQINMYNRARARVGVNLAPSGFRFLEAFLSSAVGALADLSSNETSASQLGCQLGSPPISARPRESLAFAPAKLSRLVCVC